MSFLPPSVNAYLSLQPSDVYTPEYWCMMTDIRHTQFTHSYHISDILRVPSRSWGKFFTEWHTCWRLPCGQVWAPGISKDLGSGAGLVPQPEVWTVLCESQIMLPHDIPLDLLSKVQGRLWAVVTFSMPCSENKDLGSLGYTQGQEAR